MHMVNCSPRDTLLSNSLPLAWGSCMLVPGACCGQLHLTSYHIILGNFASLWNLLKSHFREMCHAFQTGQLAELVRKNMFVCISERWFGNNWKTKTAGCCKRNKEMTTCHLTRCPYLDTSDLGRSKDAAALRQLSVNWGKNINWKAQTCPLMWGYWNQPLTFVI